MAENISFRINAPGGVDVANAYSEGVPYDGAALAARHGSDADPVVAADDVPSHYFQRVDASVLSEAHGSPALIRNGYFVTVRQPEGRGYVQNVCAHLIEDGLGADSQSVALTAQAQHQGEGACWAGYDIITLRNDTGTITAHEFDVSNATGADFPYVEANPVGQPHIKCQWNYSFGRGISFWEGYQSATTTLSSGEIIYGAAGCGQYWGPGSVTTIGVDWQATPETVIKLKGASEDGRGVSYGGIGIDTGAIPDRYGSGDDQAAIHMRQNRLSFGAPKDATANPDGGQTYLQFIEDTGSLTYFHNGAARYFFSPIAFCPGVSGTYALGDPAFRFKAVHASEVVYSGNVRDLAGPGSPEGVVDGDLGSTYRRTDNALGPRFYVKEFAPTSNTGWVAK